MSNLKIHKELKPIKQEHNGPTPNFDNKISNIAKYLAGSKVTIAGQSIERSSEGTRAAFNVHNIKKGDIIHGVSKYVGKSGEIPGDLDFTFRESTRPSSQKTNVKHWTVTGTK